jgi:glycosyltransferase involved in cell wall biosynthesis
MINRINLVIDCRMINMSGIGTYLKNIIPELIASQQFNITCLGYNDLEDFKWVNNVKVIPMKSPILSLSEQLELPRKIPTCDVFWSPNWNIPLLFIKAKKRIVTIHDVYHLANPQHFSKINIILVKFYMAFIKTFYRKIITVSDFSKREIVKYANISPDLIKVIPLAVENNYTDFVPEFETEDSYILYVGNVKPHKNLLLSLKAFEQIKDKEIKFFIVGKKEGFITNDDELVKSIKSLDKRVFFTGEISDTKLKTYYKNAKLFLFPSKYEGFGLPILEAMKFELPIISSSSGSIPEVAGECVIYFNALDKSDLVSKIDGFLSGEIKCNTEKYSNQLNKFDWTHTVAQHIRLFNQFNL